MALIGDNEQQTSLPEYSNWGARWDKRARGLGATIAIPTTSAGDDNMRCATPDRYWNQDILVHEFAHGVHLVAAQYVIPGFALKVRAAYEAAMAAGLWEGTYAATNYREYWVSQAVNALSELLHPIVYCCILYAVSFIMYPCAILIVE